MFYVLTELDTEVLFHVFLCCFFGWKSLAKTTKSDGTEQKLANCVMSAIIGLFIFPDNSTGTCCALISSLVVLRVCSTAARQNFNSFSLKVEIFKDLLIHLSMQNMVPIVNWTYMIYFLGSRSVYLTESQWFHRDIVWPMEVCFFSQVEAEGVFKCFNCSAVIKTHAIQGRQQRTRF